ncbi:methyltransferase family protein [Kribbella orskensis]|uniref:Methyltransferase family protein n=1 Tax=Kribbella orskensis TaxID=2512216 RepID=A0ABY2BIB5_9ACTN|nr:MULTISPECIES: class I SAM-dependent methyltransferase [Kribbella]TCN38758.1 methyltransferase family protein [Kribbella sp. VKM Ac-2500]TCO20939.1 methyltransferase family protein [Kribbella orskensis]
MDPSSITSLLTAPGDAVLAEACAAFRPGGELKLVEQLRRRYDAAVVTAAVTQASLRHRAAAKFGAEDAARMYFTPDGLEQATRTTVGVHRAARIAGTIPGATVVDLGCGIGGDLISAARAGLRVTGVERDPATAAAAQANLAALGLPGEVLVGDAEAQDVTQYEAVFADPARRADGKRVFDHNAYSPPWSFITDLLAGTACVKVAPGIPHDAVPDGVEAEWVSDAGEVKEAALWSGKLYAGTSRRATLLPGGATVTTAPEVDSGPVGQYIYEPDGAVVRAGLVTAVAAAVDGWLLDPRIAYVTGSSLVATPLAAAYEVIEEVRYREKALRAWVRSNGIGTLEIKKRGVDFDPAQLRKKLAPKGSASATLIVTRIGRDAVAYSCRRVSTQAS